MSGGYPKFRNDRGVPEICIGVKEFMCIGESLPQDHPHVYINMGEADTILCPYCATRFCFDPRLTLLEPTRQIVSLLTTTRSEQSRASVHSRCKRPLPGRLAVGFISFSMRDSLGHGQRTPWPPI
jgi:uncharacterized Zn-finger protein